MRENAGLQRNWVRMFTTFFTIAVMIMIFAFSTEEAEQSNQTSGMISERIVKMICPGYENMSEAEQRACFNEVQHYVRKTAHFTEYAVLGLLLRICLESWMGERKKNIQHSWAGATVYAVTDELHQLLTDGRSGQWQDVLIDSSGALAGVLAASWLLKKIRSGKKAE